MTQIEKIKEWVKKQKKETLARNSIGVITGKALFVDANELLSFLDTLEGGSSEIPTLPFAEKEGIPGKDFIPVEWVDACERYGKWIIVKVALISELLFQLLTTGIGGWGKRPEQEPEVDLSIKDVELLHTFLYAVKNNKQGAFTFTRLSDEQYQEVLRRFKNAK